MIVEKESGFTITELLIAVSVGAIASVLIMTAFVYTYGSVLVEQSRTGLTRQSQLFLRRVTEDIRLSNELRTSNTIPDSYRTGPGPDGSEGWVTSDPANILVATIPATDADNNLLEDPVSGNLYYHEVIYYRDNSNGKMYRRLLANPDATSSAQFSTCPPGTVGCRNDIELASSIENLLFEFYDVNDEVTSTPELGRSVAITANTRKQVYGQDLQTSNTTRVTLRNEN